MQEFLDILRNVCQPIPEQAKNSPFHLEVEQLLQQQKELKNKCQPFDSDIQSINIQIIALQCKRSKIEQQMSNLTTTIAQNDRRLGQLRKFLLEHPEVAAKMKDQQLSEQQKDYLLEWYQVDYRINIPRSPDGYVCDEELQNSYGAFRVLAKISNAELIALRSILDLQHQFPACYYIDCETDGDTHFVLKDYLRNQQQIAILFPQENVKLDSRKILKTSY